MKSALPSTPNDILDQFKAARLHALADRETEAQEQRKRLRESTVQLREPSHHPALSPASTSQPTFKIGEAKGFPFVAERGETTPGNGHLSGKGGEEFFTLLKDAASKPDAASRDNAVGRAAKVAAHDWAAKHGITGRHAKDGLLSTALHEARAQATFVSREIGEKLGVGPVQSTIIGYSLERALEKEGFKVLANHAIDKSVDFFRATASSVASASGMRHSAESTLSKSLNWLSSHGVTREGLKDALGKHAGKLSIVAEISQHPEVVQKVAYALSKSDKVMDGVMMLAKDDEFRKAVGTLTLSAGETIAGVNKGAGSVAILAGSALRGDSTEDTARHAFRAALTVLGGAAGGLAGGGVASLATGTVGAMAGSWVADKLLDIYDKHLGKGPHVQEHTVSQQDRHDSTKVIADRVAHKMADEAKHLQESGKMPAIPAALAERGREMEREYGMGKTAPGKP
ncbi:hypothetical protein WJ96_07460 [Burkholderia ubonensis]|uniref:Uncharacterized protein n=1 Tax=Burkholderia ubonensis TaxID=101571 RepID=A0AAW3MYF1_9BURK|nr:hypothetical protein [Burkholderia ubonensis]KVP75534.1 hypothetical protein WJ93_09250 [Burkholderia ubonensis]KVP98348.1 hypothetical protein WJ96_07460 [Burkholderia ubonensis]KVZ93046.1 hypothetical protein WL25_19120 [Burkholderia ubonensis]